jgi:hypothetical protein
MNVVISVGVEAIPHISLFILVFLTVAIVSTSAGVA